MFYVMKLAAAYAYPWICRCSAYGIVQSSKWVLGHRSSLEKENRHPELGLCDECYCVESFFLVSGSAGGDASLSATATIGHWIKVSSTHCFNIKQNVRFMQIRFNSILFINNYKLQINTD